MYQEKKPIRVLFSFGLRLGAERICTIAWHQIAGVAAAGAKLTVCPAAISQPLPPPTKVWPTLAWGKLRLPNRLLGPFRYAALHDWIVSRRIEKMVGQIDIIHAWPLSSLRTLQTAKKLGIPTVLERCNAHTGFACEVVAQECARLGVELPPNHEHAVILGKIRKEEEEYQVASVLLCPSEFVVKTFVDRSFPREKLARSIYGVDEKKFYADRVPRDRKQGLKMIFVGVCAVRKGLHYALEAWLQSAACRDGTFVIAGEFLPAYQKKLAPMLAHPSVKALGHRTDIQDLVRGSDILVLPSIEEGFALVCTEAMASGCIPLVSQACTDLCRHMENSLVHPIGDVASLTDHINMLHHDRALLEKLRVAGLKLVPEISWTAAGVKLLGVYEEVVAAHRRNGSSRKVA